MSRVTQRPEPAPLHETVAELLALSDERESWLRRVLTAEESGYARGLADGIVLGRKLEGAERDAAWNRIARPIARGGTSYADLERRRWTLRGEERTRQTFGQAHPDDYRGTGAA